MNTWYRREVTRLQVAEKTIYACMFVHRQALVNLLFYEKTENHQWKLLMPSEVAHQDRQLIIDRFVKNPSPLDKEDVHEFLRWVDETWWKAQSEIHAKIKQLGEYVDDFTVDSFAGIPYLVIRYQGQWKYEVNLLRKENEEWITDLFPTRYAKAWLYDYLYHKHKIKTPFFFLSDDFVYGIKRDEQHADFVYAYLFHLTKAKIEAKEGYILQKKKSTELTWISPHHIDNQMEKVLRRQGVLLINQLEEEINKAALR